LILRVKASYAWIMTTTLQISRSFARLIPAVLLVLGLIHVTGCNTVRGVGDDLKGAANVTEKVLTKDSADDQQK